MSTSAGSVLSTVRSRIESDVFLQLRAKNNHPVDVTIPALRTISTVDAEHLVMELQDRVEECGGSVASSRSVKIQGAVATALVPSRISFPSPVSAAAYIGKKRVFVRTREYLSRFPAKEVPLQVLKYLMNDTTAADIRALEAGVQFVSDENLSGLHASELPWPSDGNSTSAATWIRKSGFRYALAALSTVPEKNWTFRVTDEVYVRFEDCLTGVVQDRLPITQACGLVAQNPPSFLLVHENRVVNTETRNYLAGKNVRIISGAGNALSGYASLTAGDSLTDTAIGYAGDIDDYGFAMLARFRSMFPNRIIASYGMDSDKFIDHDTAQSGVPIKPATVDRSFLTPQELHILDTYCVDGFRHEQERTPLSPQW